jgi:hypothetical protein
MNIMYRGNKPRIVPILIVVVIAALVIAALVSIGRVLFTGSDSTETGVSESQQISDDTLNTAIGRAVQFTERGPIVADENFRSYQIVVTPTARTYTTYSGYLDRIVTRKTYQNNSRAYEELVHALDKADISKTQNAANGDDIRGVCATNGRLYVYETTNNDAVTHTLWTSTCSGSRGNMGANVAQVKALFVNQVPDFDATYMQ